MRRSFQPFRLGVLLLASVFVASLVAIGPAPGAAQEEEPEIMPSDARGPASIDAGLAADLGAGGTAEAVITTWTRKELDIVSRLRIAHARLRRLPMAFAVIDQKQLNALAAAPEVRSVWRNDRFPIEMTESTYVVRARDAWKRLGVTGAGIEIAVIDTGIDGSHADADNLVEFCETTISLTSSKVSTFCSPFNARTGNAGPAGPTNTARGDATDDDGHGTHVSGTISGTGDASGGRASPLSVVGVAPDAKLRVYSANISLALAGWEILSSYDDLIFKKANGFNQVVAVSNSWGGGTGNSYDRNDPINVAVNEAYKVGILSIFAAGNSGPEHNTLTRQCVNPFVVCVAATTKNDSAVMFSSRGRPSAPADTNRDGVVDGRDVRSDNHDRRLGQALSVGLYRPALAAQAFRTASGRLPTPTELTRALERSANANKLPGWEAEEVGAGRLNAFEAVRLASAKGGKTSLGYPTPPGLARTESTFSGCTTAASWSTGTGFGEHFFDVPANAERLRITVRWTATGENMYLRLWRPGVDPNATATGAARVFPDQEAIGLVFVGNSRFVDVRAPEAGTWRLRVFSRVDVVAEPPCGGTNYAGRAELFSVGTQPSVSISSPGDGATVTGVVGVEGKASYRTAWDGVTNAEVPLSGTPPLGATIAGVRLFMHGAAHDGFTGVGSTDVVAGKRPFLSEAQVGDGLRASWTTTSFLNGTAVDPAWVWKLSQPTTLSGEALISFWASCATCGLGELDADWVIRFFTDGALAFQQRVRATPAVPNVPSRLNVQLALPTISAANEIRVMIDPVFIDTQEETTLYYDSSQQCEAVVSTPPANAPEQSLACDSYALLPVVTDSAGTQLASPANVRVTELHKALRVEWNAVSGATQYDVHRGTDPAFAPTSKTRRATVNATTYLDGGVSPHRTFYYRVVAVQGASVSPSSLLAYGTPTTPSPPDQTVRVRLDRLFGPAYWEFAETSNGEGTVWRHTWDSAEVSPGAHVIAAHSYQQGVRSTAAVVAVQVAP